MKAANKYPMGATVHFLDGNAVGPLMDDTTRSCVGVVNGPPIVQRFPDGAETWVPLWCDRVGREATTIWVAEDNIVSVDTVRP